MKEKAFFIGILFLIISTVPALADVACVDIIYGGSGLWSRYFETDETSITLQAACDALNNNGLGTPSEDETE